MSDPLLIRSDTGHIAVLTLNSPHNLNALSEAMMAAFSNALDGIAGDRNIRVVLIKGEGRAFCAGHDLKEMATARKHEDGGKAYFSELFETCSRLMMQITRLPQPVIALPHGIATAAGCQLVATCDLAIAAEDTQFGVNGVNIGLFCSTPMVALSRAMQRKKVLEMLLTGSFIGAEEAKATGLLNKIVPSDALHTAGMQLAETIAEKFERVVAVGKEAFYAQAELPLGAAYEYTAEIMAENMMFEETQAAIHDFITKPRDA